MKQKSLLLVACLGLALLLVGCEQQSPTPVSQATEAPPAATDTPDPTATNTP